jgi:DNA-binding NarL/FixJ family response regulator
LSQAVSSVAVEYYLSQSGARSSPLERLNEREREVLRLLVDGQTSTEIAEHLGLSSKTVDNYRSTIMHKLDIHHLPGLVKFAIQHGVISLE